MFFAGVIYDLSSSYQIAFYVAGACSTLATCLLFLVPVLMPKDTYNCGRGRAETVQFEGSDEKSPLDGTHSPDSSVPTTSTKASLGSCQKLNSNMHLAPSRSYLDRYWDLPKRASMRASMASLLSFSPLQPTREVLVVVEKVSQVWSIERRNTTRLVTASQTITSRQFISILKKQFLWPAYCILLKELNEFLVQYILTHYYRHPYGASIFLGHGSQVTQRHGRFLLQALLRECRTRFQKRQWNIAILWNRLSAFYLHIVDCRK